MEEMIPAPAEQQSIAEAPAEAPVEQQAPEPAEKAPSRRDALEKAFAKVDGDDAPTEGRERGPDGKFVAKAPEAQDKPQDAPKPAASDAPSRFSADAKAAWAQAPAPVQAEIKRAITELEGGLQQYQRMFEPLKPYYDLAKQSNVDLPETLGNYVRMEQLLAKDMRLGLTAVAQNFGMTLEQMVAKATGAPQGQQPADAKDREILALRQELQAIRGEVGQVSQTMQQQRQTAIMSEVETFAKDHPRFDELADEIANLLKTGYASDLADAYAKADRLNPGQQPAPVAPAPAPQQRPARSVTGAPSAGSNPGTRQPSQSRTEALRRAFGAAGLT